MQCPNVLPYEAVLAKLTAFFAADQGLRLVDSSIGGAVAAFIRKGGPSVALLNFVLGVLAGYYFGPFVTELFFDEPKPSHYRAMQLMCAMAGATFLHFLATVSRDDFRAWLLKK